jgi:hypothetical protein
MRVAKKTLEHMNVSKTTGAAHITIKLVDDWSVIYRLLTKM